MHHHVGIILTSVHDASMAKTLAHGLVEQQLAACVQISASGSSVYHWDGSAHEEAECYLSIKAPLGCRDGIIAWLEQHHPYDTPEIIVLEAQAAKAYSNWMQQVTEIPET